MTEDQLRALVRESIARHLGASSAPGQPVSPSPLAPGFPLAVAGSGPATTLPWRGHPSHVRFVLVTGRDGDGPCLVEPTVGCTHCGFCQSYGH